LETGGVDRSGTAAAIFDESLDGKSVLDLGCKFGYFCFYAEEHGASKVLGADIDAENIRKSRLLGECRASKAEFKRIDIETAPIPGQFDYVLCLNVLHHLRNPVSALEKLIAATRQKLILEVAGFALRDRRQNGVSFLSAVLLSRQPILYLAPSSSQTFFITMAAIRTLLLEKRADFSRVDIVRAGPKGRPIIIAHRRRIDKLLIVAGMPASGKSTFINHLISPAGGQMANSLGIDLGCKWEVLQFGKLNENPRTELGSVILHYNISKYVVDGDLYQHSNALSDIISVANEVTLVTLRCPSQRSLSQFAQFRAGKTKLFETGRRRRKIKKIMELYQDPNRLDDIYVDWWRFVANAGLPAFSVSHDGAGYSVSRHEATYQSEARQAQK
jgi:SAM-dependent methyltransferase